MCAYLCIRVCVYECVCETEGMHGCAHVYVGMCMSVYARQKVGMDAHVCMQALHCVLRGAALEI